MSARTKPRPAALSAVGVILALACVLCGCSPPSLTSLPAPHAVSGPTYELHADFHDVLNLPIGAKVKNEGAVIGEVTSISTSNFLAHVTMRIARATTLPVGTTAEVRFTTPLGEDYIAVTMPSTKGAAVLAAGARIPATATSSAPTIEDAFAALSVLINGGGLDKVGTIIDEINAAVKGRSGTIRYVLTQMDALVRNLNSHRGDINRALSGLSRLSSELAGDNGVIAQALNDFAPALSVLAGETGRLVALEEKIAGLGSVAGSVLDRGTGALLTDLDLLRPALDSLSAARGTLVPTMQALTKFGSQTVASTPGDYLTSVATLTLVFNDTPLLPHATTPAATGAVAVTHLLGGGG